MSVSGDMFKEAFRPFGSPSTVYFNGKEERIAREQGSVFDRGLATRGQLNEVGRQASELGGFRQQLQAGIANAPDREGRVIAGRAATVTQQQFGDQQTGAVTHADVLDNALKRAKTRVGINTRGDNAVRNQQLKDRLTEVRAGMTEKARALDVQVKGQNISSGVNVGAQDAIDRVRAAQADAFGSIAGGIGAEFKDAFSNRKSSPTPEKHSLAKDGF